MARILLTGAAGYIGSHTWLALLEAGHTVVGLDNFCNSSPKVLNRLQGLVGGVPLMFERVDLQNTTALQGVFERHRVDAVVHFAALKAVGESVARPLEYYSNNVGGLVNLCRAIREFGNGVGRRFVFSSSATVYGNPVSSPLREDADLCAINPYGQTKLMGETILRDLGVADAQWRTMTLRYFNPVGAHESGRIGEDPRGTPHNLMPYVAQVAVGRREFLNVFGNDYDTPDGTGVRDYIHVVDLAEGHVAAVNHLLDGGESLIVNLGTGVGTSVLQLVEAYAKASGRSVPYRIAPRRQGDAAACWADPSLAQERLGWYARHDLSRMCADSWNWQSMNPHGFDT
jgi:UDP-glucose 4-epimerase